jgi:hypothetical protein
LRLAALVNVVRDIGADVEPRSPILFVSMSARYLGCRGGGVADAVHYGDGSRDIYLDTHNRNRIAPPAGFEPATRCLEGSRSIR